jgi:hypothetical protein
LYDLEIRLYDFENRFDDLEIRLYDFLNRFNDFENRLYDLENRLNDFFNRTNDFLNRLYDLENRLYDFFSSDSEQKRTGYVETRAHSSPFVADYKRYRNSYNKLYLVNLYEYCNCIISKPSYHDYIHNVFMIT